MKTRKTFKKLLACVLAIILVVPTFALAFAENEEAMPVIYITGQGPGLVSAEKEVIYPVNIPDGYIGDVCKKLVVPLSLAMASGDYKEYGNGLYDAIIPFTDKMKCDNNGEVTNGSGPQNKSSTTASIIRENSNLKVYYFAYDWRLDPVDVVDSLDSYVSYVKTKENVPKVNVIARCLGANIMLAYMDKFGSNSIAQCVLCSSSFDGFDSIGAIFAGEIKLDSDAIERFVSVYLSTDKYADDPTFEIARCLVTCINATPILDFSAETLMKVLGGIRGDAMRRLLRDSVGTMPSFWSYIGDNYYEKAKAYLFDGAEDEFAGLIEKIDNFHYNVLNNYNEILDKAESDGAFIYNVCKYGFQAVPVTGKDFTMGDSLAGTKSSSMGATCSTLTGKLSKDYLEKADMKYVSPDRQIDASTCKYPEHTWFIKNLAHRNMPTSIDDLFLAILETPGYTTVDNVGAYPQFLIASDDGSVIKAQTKLNSAQSEKYNTNPIKALIMILVDLLKMLFKIK